MPRHIDESDYHGLDLRGVAAETMRERDALKARVVELESAIGTAIGAAIHGDKPCPMCGAACTSNVWPYHEHELWCVRRSMKPEPPPSVCTGAVDEDDAFRVGFESGFYAAENRGQRNPEPALLIWRRDRAAACGHRSRTAVSGLPWQCDDCGAVETGSVAKEKP